MSEPGADAGLEVPDQLLADALDMAIGIAAAGAKLKPPLAHPAALRSLFRFQRLPAKALSDARAAIEGDPEFRARVGSVVSAELVGEAGLLWLQRPDGWRERLARLVEHSTADDDDASLRAQLRRAERRREAAERAAAQALAELDRSRHRPASQTAVVQAARDDQQGAAVELERLRAEVRRLQTELRHSTDRLRAAVDRADRAAAQLQEAERRAAAAEQIRDDLLAQRVDLPVEAVEPGVAHLLAGASWLAGAIDAEAARAQELSSALRALADDVGALEPRVAEHSSAPSPVARRDDRQAPARRPLPLPGGIYGSSRDAADHLLQTPGVVVLVDGYNVAKLGWPQLTLEQQRDRCIASAEDIARRHGADIRIVFDGADVPGAGSRRRALVRVAFSTAGVSADDEIRRAVQSLPAAVPVIVVTDDRAVITDVRAAGANVLGSRQWLEASGHLGSPR